MRATLWQSVGGNARDRCVFWAMRSCCTDLVCVSFLPRLQEVRSIDKTRNQLNEKTYPSDLTDEEWEWIKELIPAAKSGGRPRTLCMRAVLNAIFLGVSHLLHTR